MLFSFINLFIIYELNKVSLGSRLEWPESPSQWEGDRAGVEAGDGHFWCFLLTLEKLMDKIIHTISACMDTRSMELKGKENISMQTYEIRPSRVHPQLFPYLASENCLTNISHLSAFSCEPGEVQCSTKENLCLSSLGKNPNFHRNRVSSLHSGRCWIPKKLRN